MEQSPLCYAALEYIHSLIGAREEKRGKKREKEGEELKTIPFLFMENWDPPLAIHSCIGMDREQDVPEGTLFRPC